MDDVRLLVNALVAAKPGEFKGTTPIRTCCGLYRYATGKCSDGRPFLCFYDDEHEIPLTLPNTYKSLYVHHYRDERRKPH